MGSPQTGGQCFQLSHSQGPFDPRVFSFFAPALISCHWNPEMIHWTFAEKGGNEVAFITMWVVFASFYPHRQKAASHGNLGFYLFHFGFFHSRAEKEAPEIGTI